MANSKSGEEIIQLSIDFLEALRDGKNTDSIVASYAALSIEDIQKGIDTKEEKLAFWINTYNAFVQEILVKDPSKFDNRGAFFGAAQVAIGGELLSFDQIEHGIIRANRWKITLGHFKKPFPKSFVRKLRTKKPDGRVHLALNCGALSCPPIAIFSEKNVNEELDLVSEMYLKETTIIDGNVVTVTPLASWFRADFGGKKGLKKNYLKKYGVLESIDDIELKFGSYDWTLSTGNYRDVL